MDYQPKRKRGERLHPDGFPCPICGGKSFTWGHTIRSAQSASKDVYFRPLDKGPGGGRKTAARECNTCGSVLLFTMEAENDVF